MKRNIALLAVLCLAIAGIVCVAAAQNANVAGPWTLSMNFGGGGGRGGGGGQGGGAGRMGRGGPQTLTFTQDGDKLSGTLHSGRGDSPVTGTVSGNNISFSVTRQTPNGEMKTDYTGTVSGETMKGTVSMRGNSVEWTATKGAPAEGGAGGGSTN